MIHKEGNATILITILFLAIVNGLVYYFLPNFQVFFLILSFLFFLLILQFFRNPKRSIAQYDDHKIYAPADGKVVVIEEAVETEYFKDKRLQLSIFMNPLNVHVNRNPIGGKVNYYRYHKGKYLVAWHPKSSTENERTTVVYDNGSSEILLRQIAGALAKRIVAYVKEGQEVIQGEDMGFIKFGSRVDLYLPLGTEVKVSIDQKVKGNKTLVAVLS